MSLWTTAPTVAVLVVCCAACAGRSPPQMDAAMAPVADAGPPIDTDAAGYDVAALDAGSVDAAIEPTTRLVSSVPALDAVEVYPAEVYDGAAERVRIELRFSAPMDPGLTEVEVRGVGLEPERHRGVYSADAMTLTIDVIAPLLSGRRPLADETVYDVGLEALRDASGAPLIENVGLHGHRLRFTTGRHDPLLNHACGHVAFGPFDQIDAASTPGATAPRGDRAHTLYTIWLPGDGGGYRGYVRLGLDPTRDVHLFLERPLDLFVIESGTRVPVDVRPTPQACAGIEAVGIVSSDSITDAHLEIASTEERARVIVELVDR